MVQLMKKSELTADDLQPLVAKLQPEEQIRLAYFALRVARGIRPKVEEEEDELTAIRETLQLLSIPGMRESVQKGLQTPLEECAEDPGW